MARVSIWDQVCRTTSKSWQMRFQKHLDEFEEAGMNCAPDSGEKMTPDTYIAWSRKASGFVMGLALIEYVEELKLADDVFDSPVVAKLRQDALDIVIWMHVCDMSYESLLFAFIPV